MYRDAIISDDKLYRWRLDRIWDMPKGLVLFVMLNPSIADSEVDDATVRRCMKFAYNWGFGGIVVVNLFAYRSTNPDKLLEVEDPVGQHNDLWISNAVFEAKRVVLAWGALPQKLSRMSISTRARLQDEGLPACLGKTKAGYPRHPLYVAGKQQLIPWRETS